MGEKVYHFVYISNTTSSGKQIWATTTGNNETVSFVDENGAARIVNSLTIYSKDADLYIALPSGGYYCSYIKAGESKSFDFLRLENFQVLGSSGQSYRFEAMSY